MLVSSESSEKIKYRSVVKIKCDKCGGDWETTYSVYRRKKLEKDYCRSCKNSLGITGVKGGHSELVRQAWSAGGIRKVNAVDVKCKCCGKDFKRNAAQIVERVFCSTDCRHDDDLKSRYGNIAKFFEDNPDEVAYFIGLVMGDGCISRMGERTSMVSISFDAKYGYLIETAKIVMNVLGVTMHRLDRNECGTVVLETILPRTLLDKYGLDIDGDKYRFQPCVNGNISHNPHFILGLINSDGYVARRIRGGCYMQLTNTVRSIVDDFCYGLFAIGLKFNRQETFKKNSSWRMRYDVFVRGRDQIDKFKSLLKYDLKKEVEIL